MRYVEAGRKSLRLAQEQRNRPPAGGSRLVGGNPRPRAARLARAGILARECASLDTLDRVRCYRARGLVDSE